MAILIQPQHASAARNVEDQVGAATPARAKRKVYVAAGVPTAGTGVVDGVFCLDTTNDNVYRYYDSAWDRLDITT